MDNNSSSINQLKRENVCRTCLSKENLSPLFSEENCQKTDIDFTGVILAVTQLQITKDDGLPGAICETCQQSVQIAYSFITRSHEVDYKLRAARQVAESNDPVNATSPEHETAMDYSNWEDVSESDYEDKKRSCSKCKKTFRTERLLEKHMTKNHANQKHAPKRRGRPRKDVSTVVEPATEGNQRKPNPKRGSIKCFFCPEIYNTAKELMRHYEIGHNEIMVYRCNDCKCVFLELDTLKKHGVCPGTERDTAAANAAGPDYQQTNENLSYEIVLLHSVLAPSEYTCKSRVVQCLYCGSLHWSKANLKQHIDDKHKDKSLRCNVCSKEFATLRLAKRHEAFCDGTETVFVCQDCGQEFQAELSLNKHILSQHAGANASVAFLDKKKREPQLTEPTMYPCEVCNASFSRPELLADHVDEHNTIYECHICRRKFNRIYNLMSHARVHNKKAEQIMLERAPPKRHLCNYCGQGFSNTSNLIVHVRRHTGEKPYKCDFCDKAYPRSYDLAVHRRTHTGEKPCSCPLCGKSFSRSNKLTRHMHTHTGQKPYKCSYCDKAFAQSNDLRVHIRRHTGDKPYICEICNSRFIHGSALQIHRRAAGHYPPNTSMLPPSGYLPLKQPESPEQPHQQTGHILTVTLL